MPKLISSTLWPLLELIFPRACALCGIALPPSSAYPLCYACENGLPRLPSSAKPPGQGEETRGPTDGYERSQRCERCGKALISERGICLRCRTSDYHFDSAYPLYAYRGLAKELIINFKLRNRRSLAGFLARELSAVARERFPDCVVVPVPPRPGKVRKKGWDQVDAIARLMEQRHDVRVERILIRTRGGLEQKKLDFKARALNMRACIRVQGKVEAFSHYLVLDDVFTTGATLSACAYALKEAGAQRVDALVLAAD